MSKEVKYWRVKRWILEEYGQEAESKQEAIDKANDPYAVTVIKTTATRVK